MQSAQLDDEIYENELNSLAPDTDDRFTVVAIPQKKQKKRGRPKGKPVAVAPEVKKVTLSFEQKNAIAGIMGKVAADDSKVSFAFGMVMGLIETTMTS